MSIIGQIEIRATLGHFKHWPFISDRRRRQSNQPLAVMLLRGFGLEFFAGDVVVNCGDAAGHGMPPGHALHRRQPRERQRVSEAIHADVGVEQNVELIFENDLSRRGEIIRQHNILIGRGAESIGDCAAVRAEGKYDHFEPLARELLEETDT